MRKSTIEPQILFFCVLIGVHLTDSSLICSGQNYSIFSEIRKRTAIAMNTIDYKPDQLIAIK